jgi:hypothetical protein
MQRAVRGHLHLSIICGRACGGATPGIQGDSASLSSVCPSAVCSARPLQPLIKASTRGVLNVSSLGIGVLLSEASRANQ